MVIIKFDIEQRKKRWKDIFDRSCPPQKVFVINIDLLESKELQNNMPINPYMLLWPEYKKRRVENILKKYEMSMDRCSWLKDDYVPHLNTLTSTEIFAEAFGCKVHRSEDNMPFALSFVQTASEASKIKIPRLEDTPLMLQFEIADELRCIAGEDAVLRMVDVQSPMDIVAQIWGKADLFVSMIEEPEAVKELAEKVRVLMFEFFDEWFSRYGNEYIAHFPNYYICGGITLSEDEIGSVSSDMFNTFFLDELNALSNRYGGIGIHCCADARHQWDNLKKVEGLKHLNFVQPPELIDEALLFFGEDIVHWHMHRIEGLGQEIPLHKTDFYPENLRLVIAQTAHSRDEALRLSEQLWKACGRE